MASKPRLLFIYLHPASFVREDVRILEEKYELVPFRFGGEAKPGPVGFGTKIFKQLQWLLRELPGAAAVYGWFADYHMVLPVLAARLLDRPVAVAIGGFDAISLPSLDYGIVTSRWRRPLARLVLRFADVLLPVSPSLVYSRNTFSENASEVEQGLRKFFPELTTEIQVVSTGYDPEAWPMGPLEREPIVSTVGMIDSDRTLRRKGIDLMIEAARQMPDVRFRIIGVQHPQAVRARYHPPENVELIEPVAREALVAHYHAASVYLQLSRAEGLPNVLCEAMLCGCIPVGSRMFGIPDGIGETGFIVDRPETSAIVDALRHALSADRQLRTQARRRVIEHFSLERRRSRLLEIMDHLLRAHADS